MANMKCPKCGWEGMGVFKECVACGARLDIPYVPVSEQPTTPGGLTAGSTEAARTLGSIPTRASSSYVGAGDSEDASFRLLAWVGIVLLVAAIIVALMWGYRAGDEGGLFDSSINGVAYLLATAVLWQLGLACLIIWYLGSQHVLRKIRHREMVWHLARLEQLTSSVAQTGGRFAQSAAPGPAPEGD